MNDFTIWEAAPSSKGRKFARWMLMDQQQWLRTWSCYPSSGLLHMQCWFRFHDEVVSILNPFGIIFWGFAVAWRSMIHDPCRFFLPGCMLVIRSCDLSWDFFQKIDITVVRSDVWVSSSLNLWYVICHYYVGAHYLIPCQSLVVLIPSQYLRGHPTIYKML